MDFSSVSEFFSEKFHVCLLFEGAPINYDSDFSINKNLGLREALRLISEKYDYFDSVKIGNVYSFKKKYLNLWDIPCVSKEELEYFLKQISISFSKLTNRFKNSSSLSDSEKTLDNSQKKKMKTGLRLTDLTQSQNIWVRNRAYARFLSPAYFPFIQSHITHIERQGNKSYIYSISSNNDPKFMKGGNFNYNEYESVKTSEKWKSWSAPVISIKELFVKMNVNSPIKFTSDNILENKSITIYGIKNTEKTSIVSSIKAIFNLNIEKSPNQWILKPRHVPTINNPNDAYTIFWDTIPAPLRQSLDPAYWENQKQKLLNVPDTKREWDSQDVYRLLNSPSLPNTRANLLSTAMRQMINIGCIIAFDNKKSSIVKITDIDSRMDVLRYIILLCRQISTMQQFPGMEPPGYIKDMNSMTVTGGDSINSSGKKIFSFYITWKFPSRVRPGSFGQERTGWIIPRN